MPKESAITTSAKQIWARQKPPIVEVPGDIEKFLTENVHSLFHAGDYYCYVFDLQKIIYPYVSPGMTTVLGYEPEEFVVDQMLQRIHPEDQVWFLAIENRIVEFFSELKPEQVYNYKVRYDYRLRKKDGDYIRILQQILPIESDKAGSVVYVLGIHTDISHLKMNGEPVLSFIGLNGEPSFVDVKVKNPSLPSSFEMFTPREREILRYLMIGKTSKEIGTALGISHETANTFRRKMLKKSGARNTPELLHLVVANGWA